MVRTVLMALGLRLRSADLQGMSRWARSCDMMRAKSWSLGKAELLALTIPLCIMRNDGVLISMSTYR